MLRLQTFVPHVQQKYDWDCGLACVQMLLKRLYSASFNESKFEDVCQKLQFGESVWTIDLAQILTLFKVDYVFYTETLGVDVGYQSKQFYQGSFDLDEVRVNRLFSCATDLNIMVEKRTITLDDICVKLNQGFVAIVLVNHHFLKCNWCRQVNQLRHFMCRYCGNSKNYEDYTGHYIVVCGYDLQKKCFYFKNPSYDIPLCCVPFKVLERAWHCYGTDSDIIFVNIQDIMNHEN